MAFRSEHFVVLLLSSLGLLALLFSQIGYIGNKFPLFPRSKLTIHQGVTTDTETTLVVMSKEADLRFEIDNLKTVEREATAPDEIVHIRGEYSDHHIWHLRVRQLVLETEYRLRVIDNVGDVLDSRDFRSLNIGMRTPKIAVIACQNDSYYSQQQMMWQQVVSTAPDILFFLGDVVYANRDADDRVIATRSGHWKRYVQTRENLDFYRLRRLIPTVAIWDDSDYGLRNGTQSYVNKEATKKMFRTFFPSYPSPPVLERGPGLSLKFTAFGQNYFFFDGRSFRSAPKTGRHLGTEQSEWFFTHLERAHGLNWLLKGDPFWGGYNESESFENDHLDDFSNFIRRVKNVAKFPVAFLSGDRHVSELIELEPEQLGYRTYEMIIGPFHAARKSDIWLLTPNWRQVHGIFRMMNFLMVEPQEEASHVRVTSIGEEGQIMYQESLCIDKKKRDCRSLRFNRKL